MCNFYPQILATLATQMYFHIIYIHFGKWDAQDGFARNSSGTVLPLP